MYGLRSRIKKAQLLKSYKKLMQDATIFSRQNELESRRMQQRALRVLDQIEQLD